MLSPRGQSTAELAVPVIYIGGNGVGGPAAQDLPNAFDGRPPTRPEDSIGGLPDPNAAGFGFRGGFGGVLHGFRGDSNGPDAIIGPITLRINYIYI